MKKEKLEKEIAFLTQQVNKNIGECGLLTYNWFNSIATVRDKTVNKVVRLNKLQAELQAKTRRANPEPIKKVEPKK